MAVFSFTGFTIDGITQTQPSEWHWTLLFLPLVMQSSWGSVQLYLSFCLSLPLSHPQSQRMSKMCMSEKRDGERYDSLDKGSGFWMKGLGPSNTKAVICLMAPKLHCWSIAKQESPPGVKIFHRQESWHKDSRKSRRATSRKETVPVSEERVTGPPGLSPSTRTTTGYPQKHLPNWRAADHFCSRRWF